MERRRTTGDPLRAATLALLVLGTSLLTAGVMRGLEPQAPEPVAASRLDHDLDLDGPVTIYSDGVPVIEVTPDGAVRLLGSWSSQLSPPFAVQPAEACENGGAEIVGPSGSVPVCNGRDGEAGPMGPAGNPRLLADMVPLGDGAQCQGYLLLVGNDDGQGLGEADDSVLHADEVDAEAPVCHGAAGQAGNAGLQGPTGPPGAEGEAGWAAVMDSLVTSGDADCSTGWVELRIGVDDGANGGRAGDRALQDGEETDVERVCPAQGPKGDEGDPGTPGSSGRDGHNAVVRTADPELTVPECLNGKYVQAGTDDGDGGGVADDGVLQDGEVDASHLLCERTGTGAAHEECWEGAFVHGFDVNGSILCRPVDVHLMTVPRAPSSHVLPVAADGAEGEPDVSVGRDGLPVILYQGVDGMVFVHCSNLNCSLSTHVTIDVGVTDWYPAMTMGPDGLPLLAFHRILVGCLDERCQAYWHVQAPGLIRDLWFGHDAAAGPVVSAYNSMGRVFQCDPTTRCATLSTRNFGTTAVLVPEGTQVLDAAGSGDTFVTFRDLSTGEIVRRALSDPGDGTTVNPNYGTYPVVTATGPDGLPTILTTDRSQQFPYRVARCADMQCAAPVTWTPIPYGLPNTAPGDGPAMTIQDDGNPLLALPFEFGSKGILLVDCHDPACTQTTFRQLHGERGEVDVTLLRDGSAFVAWKDNAADRIHVYHSGGPDVNGYSARR